MAGTQNSDPRGEIVLKLYELFRQRGYEGVSIGDISSASGLGKSSLYHHFPRGKEEMAEAVVELTRNSLESNVFAPLRAAGPVEQRIDAMLAAVRRLYSGGATPCVLAALLSSDDGPLAQGTRRLFHDWAATIANALQDGGVTADDATRRANTMLALLQGGLVMTRALKDTSVFDATMGTAREVLLFGLPRGDT